MLEIVSEDKEIDKCQKKFEKNFEEKFRKKRGPFTLGFQGGNNKAVNLLLNNRIWFYHFIKKRNNKLKHWNGFGLSDNISCTKSLSIVVEINIPLSGIDNRLAGCFAKDIDTGKYFVLHRGKVGGGKKGIGKETFLSWYKQKPTEIYHKNKKISKALELACLDSESFADDISKFVERTARFRMEVNSGTFS